MLLLTLLRWFVTNTSLQFDVLLLQDGPLRSAFASLAPTYLTDDLSGRRTLLRRAQAKLFGVHDAVWIRRTARGLRARQYEAVYGNTIVCASWASELATLLRARSVCHVHEMTWMIDRFYSRQQAAALLRKMDLLLACSEATKRDLLADYDVPADRVVTIPSFSSGIEDAEDAEAPQILRRSLGVTRDTMIVGGAGSAEWRKGVDLLAPLAKALRLRRPNRDIKVIWLGSTNESEETVSLCRNDATVLGVDDMIQFLPQRSNIAQWLNAFDVIVIPSRIEPLSLIAVDALAIGKPAICFDGAGGVVEVLNDGAGAIVSFLDVDALADKVVELYETPGLRRTIEMKSRIKFHDVFRTEVQAPRIRESLERLINGSGRST